ncbi:MAG: serine hydrolase [Bacteroidales bacterium]|nr:serine hydrolase [Bacteroidales bacterium]
MKKLTILGLLLTLLLTACQTQTHTFEHVNPAQVGMSAERLILGDQLIQAAIDEGEIPGAVWAVVRHGKLVYLNALGNKAVYPDTVAMTPETVFDLASVSKCVGTTMAVMQLLEKGVIRLNDPVSRFIPDFKPWTNPETGKTTALRVVDLLTHSSGIDPYIGVDAYVERFGEHTPDSLIRYIATQTNRRFQPGSRGLYSCLNFVTLHNIVEKVTGQKFEEYVEEQVFAPLKMRSTAYNPTDEILAACAPTEIQADGLPLIGQVHDPIARRINAGNSGNAGVFSNAQDLARLCAALMNGGELDGQRILSPATIQTMSQVPEYLADGVGRALGWDNCSGAASIRGDFFDRNHTICHTGYTGTSIVLDLKNECAVILLAHRVHPYDKGALTRLRATLSNVVAGAMTD